MPSFSVIGSNIIPTPTGDIKLTIEASPDPYQIELELMRIAGELENLGPPLLASARILGDDTKERFITETDPDGDPWIPLDKDYLSNKLSLGYPENILHRTGDLEQRATQFGAMRVVGDSVFFDTSVLPSYGLIHQTGSGADNAGLASRHKSAVVNEPGYKEREGGSHESLGIGRGEALPARPFIGMSEEAEGKLYKFFDIWFDEATQIKIGSSGVVQQSIAGRFGPKVIF